MKHVGILGHSVEGAALCFRALCHHASAELGSYEHPDVTLDCIAMAKSMPALERGDHATVRALLAQSVQRLARAGADFFVCPDNTAHLALELPGEDLALPALHIAEVVAEQAASAGHRRVGVLGTRFTMEGPIYPRALGDRDIDAEIPPASDREHVHRVIFDEQVNGIFTSESRAAYVDVIGALAARGCDAVALVCTEIPLLVTPEVSPLPTLDSTRLLAQAAFEVAIGRRPLPRWRGGPVEPHPA